jgi:GNAT superfamily N-acetyltransferase
MAGGLRCDDVEVRRIRSDEGGDLRCARLAALADAPHAFASTFERELRYPDQRWSDFAHSHAAGDDDAMFAAVTAQGRWVGIAGGFRRPEQPECVHLVSMWVAPPARSTGIGRRLVTAVVDWARAVGARRVELWVTEGNEPAQRRYEREGFVVTGDVTPLPSDPCRDEVRMRLELDGPGAASSD